MYEWFENEFGRYGFTLSVTVYDLNTFYPCKKIIHPNGYFTKLTISPDLANDLHAWGRTFDDNVNELRELIKEELMRLYPEVFKYKDFTPKQERIKFKFI